MDSTIQPVTPSIGKLIRLRDSELGAVVGFLAQTNLAFGLSRFPEREESYLAICQPEDLIPIMPDQLPSQNLEEGFLAVPFNPTQKQAYFIPASLDLHAAEPFFIRNMSVSSNKEMVPDGTPSLGYKQAVQKAVDDIQNGHFLKLVLARFSQSFCKEFSAQTLLEDLVAKYPSSYTTVFQIPGQGFWFSASPEILLERQEDKYLRTVALAGTRRAEISDLKSQGWTEKEIEEQAFVTRFIKEAVRRYGGKIISEKGPYTIQAGKLVHLKTDFVIRSNAETDFLGLAKMLHPTSAVCGSPRKAAFQWLQNQEDFDRQYYAGACGIVSKKLSRLVVLLRSGFFQNGLLTLFAGAGITSCSKPEREWQETEEKLKTLSDLFPDLQFIGHESNR